jgi:lipoprotein NlpI
MARLWLIAIGFLGWQTASGQEKTPEGLYAQAEKAVAEKQMETAQTLLDEALRLDAKFLKGYQLRGRIQEARGKFAGAVADYAKVIELDPKQAENYQQRGSAHFKMGQIKESIADFDKYLEMRPERKPSHWQRGISFYYAGRYEDGQKQFEGYQTFDSNDVENAVWRFMCMVRAVGLEKARKEMLKIGQDLRVPMKEVYDLYLGKIKPADVMATAQAGKPAPEQLNRQLFYAHLYVGIYHDLLGEKQKALEHLQQAADHRIGHYMWDVARVHRDILQKELEKK